MHKVLKGNLQICEWNFDRDKYEYCDKIMIEI